MKFMMIWRATDEAFANMGEFDFDKMLETVGRFNDEMIRAGVLLAAEGLSDPSEGVVVDYSTEPPVVTDGPYGETKELIGGYWFILADSLEEASRIAADNPCMQLGLFYEIRPLDPEPASAHVRGNETPD